LAADASAHHELDRRAAEPGDGKLEAQRVAEAGGLRELAAGVDDREADPALQMHLLEGQPDSLGEPILDHAAHHVEEIDEVDDPGRVAMREPDQALSCERQRMRLNQASDRRPATSTRNAAAAEKKAPISVFFVSITSRVFIVW